MPKNNSWVIRSKSCGIDIFVENLRSSYETFGIITTSRSMVAKVEMATAGLHPKRLAQCGVARHCCSLPSGHAEPGMVACLVTRQEWHQWTRTPHLQGEQCIIPFSLPHAAFVPDHLSAHQLQRKTFIPTRLRDIPDTWIQCLQKRRNWPRSIRPSQISPLHLLRTRPRAIGGLVRVQRACTISMT